MADTTPVNGQITDAVTQSQDIAATPDTRQNEKTVTPLAHVHPDELPAAEADRGGDDTPGSGSEEATALIQEAQAMQREGEQQQTVHQDQEQ